jgi:5-methyltetrahydrofolate--homocysteine methyltransferase
MDEALKGLYDSIMEGDLELAQEKVQQALDEGIAPGRILNEGMIAAMGEVGQLFEEGEYFVPEMLIAARAMQGGLLILKPFLAEGDVHSPGKVVIGTVKGDLHDIGKNLVAMMLEGSAFEIVDLGTDVSPEKFVEAVQTSGADIVAMSALLTTTMPNMTAVIEALKEAGLRDKVKIMVGGAPLTQDYASKIGADGYAADANQAVASARALLNAA